MHSFAQSVLDSVGEADLASMSKVPGLVALLQLALGRPVTAKTPPPPAAVALYGDGQSFVVRLTPRRAAQLTQVARRVIVCILWSEDFKWATGSAQKGLVGTHVHFGYSDLYGAHPHRRAQLEGMELGPDAMLTYSAGDQRQRQRIKSIEVPLASFGSSYMFVRAG